MVFLHCWNTTTTKTTIGKPIDSNLKGRGGRPDNRFVETIGSALRKI